MERARLSAARYKRHWSLEEAAARMDVDKATLQRWEKGKSAPQAINLRRLCEVYEMTAWELGLEEEHSVVAQNTTPSDDVDDALASFRQQDFILRLMRIVWNWPYHNARYHELQTLITLELEDNTCMDHDELKSRRDTLRRLALFPIEMYGLSAVMPVTMKRPTEEILAQCASGIIACWHLKQGKELAFANDAVSKYIPTLKEITQSATMTQRKAAASLLAQCMLLKSSLANHIESMGSNTSLYYAQQAETYSETAGNFALQILAVRMQANAHDYADRWKQALQAAEKAKFLLETNKGTPVPSFVTSFVYAGLANYQSHNGQKQPALRSWEQAYTTFFAQSSDEAAQTWFPINHNQATLLLHNGLIHFYLGDFKEACSAFTEMHNFQSLAQVTRVEAFIDQALAELQREDAPRDMERCIDCWTQGTQGAIAMQSERWFNEARTAYTAMRAAWPGEKRIKDLREYVAHW